MPPSLAAFCLLALLLGMRHGFDADHLAVIDGVARLNAERRPILARFAGVLFSLGHGAVMLAVVTGAALAWPGASLPAWLEVSGTVVSIVFLLALAMLNLAAVVRTPPAMIVRPAGLRARWLANSRILTTPLGVLAVGFLFAISFDSLSQAMLFAVIGNRLGGSVNGTLAGLTFVLGMLAVDGANGWWIARLVRATGRRAAIASRIMATTTGLVSLAVCGFAFSEAILPTVAQWGDAHGLWLGVAVCVTMTFAGLLALALTGHLRATHD